MADDPLIDNYRQASAQDASQPSDAVRAAIAAKARELAAQRRDSAATVQFDTSVPAANQSSWKIRAVAGLAVLTVGSSLFWQVYREHPEQLPTTVAVVPVPAIAPAASAAEAAVDVVVEQKIERAKASASREEADAAGNAAAAPAAEAPTASRQALGALRADAAPDRARPDATDIMARYFADASTTGDSDLWVLLDARGAVLNTGRQAPADPAALKRYLEARYPRIVTAEVEMAAVSTQRGDATIHFVWLAPGSPLPAGQ